MPDADDFDIEELRALLRGETPKQPEAHTGRPSAPAASRKTTGAGPRKKAASSRPRDAKRTAAKPSARGRKGSAR